MKIQSRKYFNVGLTLLLGPVSGGLYTILVTPNSTVLLLTFSLLSASLTLIILSFLDSGATSLSIYYPESKAQTETIDLIKKHKIKKIQLLTSGIISRRELILDCLLKERISVDLAIQSPRLCVSESEKATITKSLKDILSQIKNDEFAKRNFRIRFYEDKASLRACILKNAKGESAYAFVSWYVYSKSNSTVHGSPNPSILISDTKNELMNFADEEFLSKWQSGKSIRLEKIPKEYQELL